MIRTISVVYLLLLGFLGTQANPISCRDVDKNQIALFPNPEKCSTFFLCVQGGEPVEIACPEDLHWNDNLQQCDHPHIAQCKKEEINFSKNFKSSRIYNSCVGVPSSVDLLLPNPDNCETYIQCVHGQPVVRPCPESLHWSVAARRCEWPAVANCTRNSCAHVPDSENVLLPNPEDCGSYIQCVHQQPVVRPCPSGLHWSVEDNRCEWPSNAACTVQSQNNQNYNNCSAVPINEIVLLPNPNNCSTYIQCTHQHPVVMPCPIGQHWNNATRQCDSPQNAQCRETNTTTQNHNNCSAVPVNEIVLLPNPNNCSTYIQCTHQHPVVMPCPIGLHWNNATRQCDSPQNAQCRETNTTTQNHNNCLAVPVNEIVLLPNPNNCSTYIQCTHQHPVVMPCPTGLHWNNATRQCDSPQNAQCRETNTTTQNHNNCSAVPVNEIVLLPNPNNCSTYIQCTHQHPVVMPCPTGLHWNNATRQCDSPQNAQCRETNTTTQNHNNCLAVPVNEIVLLPNPNNCSTYIQCTHQHPVVMPCPTGLHWNNATRQCDSPQNAQCRETNTTTQNHNNCSAVPVNEIVLLPNPNNCSTYIQCTHQHPVVMPCPTGLHWNNATRQCDSPQNAQCRETNTTTQNHNNCSTVSVNEIVLLPNPNNCSTYIQCTHQHPVVMPCPIGLHWNNATRQCDSPQNAQCRETNTTTQNHNNCSAVSVNEIVLLPNPNNCSTYIQCTHQHPVVMPCPTGLHWNNATRQCDSPQNAQCQVVTPIRIPNRCHDIPSNVNELLPNPADCGTYIQCVHGQEMVRPCPAGLHWSVNANRCEWPEIANCRRNSCEGVPATEDVLLPNPEDCGSYIQCVHQQPVVRPCPPGLHWGIAVNRCEWPVVANCIQINP